MNIKYYFILNISNFGINNFTTKFEFIIGIYYFTSIKNNYEYCITQLITTILL